MEILRTYEAGLNTITDKARIRAILEQDRAWSIYALGDLVPPYDTGCTWIASPADSGALVLLNRQFDPPVLFATGEPAAVAGILDEIAGERAFYLHVRHSIVPLIAERWHVEHVKPMRRLVLEPARFNPADSSRAVRLGPADVDAVQRLYADGNTTSESPDFFFPSMLDDGVFFGIRENGALISVAGTHLVAAAESVAAIGNVYTRRDRRGRGLAAQVTSAVAAELLRREIKTIALNVVEANETARRVYERLGFLDYVGYLEGKGVSFPTPDS